MKAKWATLIAAAMAVCAIGIAPSAASADQGVETPLAPQSVFAGIEPNDQSDCPAQTVCLWAGPTFGGQRSFWSASQIGCHALANIDPRSFYNNTFNKTIKFPQLEQLGGNEFGPYAAGQFLYPYTGEMCILI